MRQVFFSALLTTLMAVNAPAFANEDAAEPAADVQELNTTGPEVTQTDRAYGAYQRGMYLTAFALALPEAEAGNAAAQTLIAELYEAGLGIAKDTKKAAIWYEIAAKSGNREAQFAYSVKLLEGKDIEPNRQEGLKMLKAAADAGHPIALFNYATHLVDQRPTSATYRKVLPFYERAAEFHLADAYYALAKIYGEGLATGIEDRETSRKWLERAARAGVDTAQVELGIELLSQDPSPGDLVRAHGWFRIAANSGNVIARNRLAHSLFMGVGTKPSKVEGAMWHILASRGGRRDFDLDQLLQTMTQEERQTALEWANRWPSLPN